MRSTANDLHTASVKIIPADFIFKITFQHSVETKKQNPTQGKIAYASSSCEELGVKVGDVVGIGKSRDYRIKIDGKEYYRTRAEDFLYVVVEE